jgi:uncharacterized protein YjdB
MDWDWFWGKSTCKYQKLDGKTTTLSIFDVWQKNLFTYYS